ncbi:helix-turn-helix transcriptional regulator [Listeria booriae]|uniref:Helix-turn-helix transcriptional regulator n=1 Tax=Listeria booriae TaxID=1552123 RepID=A0A7X0XC18_9LIST|nr:helix-turn-helix transcriptional regulator [Listeria booriae]MBC1491445.1 helix-turn-helix transcriptional regulator [Listeria booriae]MBC1893112.1 helix-turn-helix transcriptional regulator [Listeria booriae]MBC1974517.1 helix-turn-helix transcriptional regulator [Listeria booriae]MBC2031808.1 helix-turn-helix transcriptional regulator [Listeria booriae]
MSNLRLLRKQRGVTMSHMAKLLGYKSVSSYQKIEEGKATLKAEHLMIIAKEFNVEPEKILDKTYS